MPTRPPARPLADHNAFAEAVAFFRSRLILTDDEFKEIEDACHEKAFTLAGVAQLDIVTDVWEAADRAVANGETLDDFRSSVEDKLSAAWGKEMPWRIETIYRVNVQRAYNQGRWAQMEHPAVKQHRPYRQFSAILDLANKNCPICPPLDGTTLPDEDGFWRTHLPPLHPNCFPAGTLVQGRFVAGLRALYAGKVIEVETVGGRRLTVTANHPVLTPQGFVPAKALHEGQHVLAYASEVEPYAGPGGLADLKNEQHRPARIEQVLGALQDMGTTLESELGPLDLHGDAVGVKGHVDVVFPGVQLLMDRESQPLQLASKGVLEVPAVQESLVAGAGPSQFAVEAVDAAPSSGPRGGELPRYRLRVSLQDGPLDPLCLGPAADVNASRYESTLHGQPSDTKFVRDLFHAGAGRVALDEIRSVRQVDFLGHVYDLQSEGGWIVADGIVTSNCRCHIVSLSESEAEEHGIDPEPPAIEASDGFGGVDDEWQPDLTEYPMPLAAEYAG